MCSFDASKKFEDYILIFPKWLFNGDLPWQKVVKSHLTFNKQKYMILPWPLQ